jgi:hypoxanthine-DNA glycosylase
MKKYSFPPISNQDATILILGTMPGAQSLALSQYYGNSRNAFWKILFTVFDAPFSTDYEERKSFLVQNHIALWDVLQDCLREGSLDSAIEQEVPNDFDSFLKAHPNIKHIFFNGQKAAAYFRKYANVGNDYHLVTLPSTSPAHAGKSFELKLNEWKIIKQS